MQRLSLVKFKTANSLILFPNTLLFKNVLDPHHISLNMKGSITALAALLGLASAQKAVVANNCPTTVFVQSFPYDGSAAGPLTSVKTGKSFSEQLRPSGSVRVPALLPWFPLVI